MSHDEANEPTGTGEAVIRQESIEAFLDREFATALAAELAKGKLPDSIQNLLLDVANSASPAKKAWLDAVTMPHEGTADA